MPVSNGNEQEECRWVVERCKDHLSRDDRSAAKAWIVTARSLFPDNFDVQVRAAVPAASQPHTAGPQCADLGALFKFLARTGH